MGYTTYSANKQGTGALAEVSFNSKDESIWLRLTKQTGTTTSPSGRQNGTYKGGARANVKLSIEEAGGIIHAVRTAGQFSAFHSTADKKTTVSFKYYHIPAQDQSKPAREGFGLTVKSGNDEWKVGYSVGAAVALEQYLEFALKHHIYAAIYSKDKEAFAKSQQGQQEPSAPAANARPAARPARQQPAPAPVEPEFDPEADPGVTATDDTPF